MIEILDDSNPSNLENIEIGQVSAIRQHISMDSEENQTIAMANGSNVSNRYSHYTLSFTERIELYEKSFMDVEKSQNTAPVIEEAYSGNEVVSTDSPILSGIIIKSDSEELSTDGQQNTTIGYVNEEINTNLSPLETETRELPGHFGAITEEDLISKSICDIFERSFDYQSPITNLSIDRTSSRKFKKNISESVLSSGIASNGLIRQVKYPDANEQPILQSLLESEKKQESQQGLSISNIQTESIPINQEKVPAEDLSNNEYLVRYEETSIKPDYEHMDLAEIQLELKNYGLKKSLKKHQAIICLNYIYNRTHPFIEKDPSNTKEKVGHSNGTGCSLNFNIGFANDNLVNSLRSYQIEENVFLPSWPRNKVNYSIYFYHKMLLH